MPSFQTSPFVVVANLDEINRSLRLSVPAVETAMIAGMAEGAEPIKSDAESLAESGISGMKRKKTSDWTQQRIGQTIHEVYITPVERGVKSRTDPRLRRKKFAAIMFGKSYNPAFEKGRPAVVAFVDSQLGRVTREI